MSMKKLYKIVLGILYTFMGLLMAMVAIVVGYAVLKPEISKKDASKSETVAESSDKKTQSGEAKNKTSDDKSVKTENSTTSEQVLTSEDAREKLCEKYSLNDDNLVYYEDMEIEGEQYWAYYVVDSGGGADESLLICNHNMSKIGMYDVEGNISKIDAKQFAKLNSYPAEGLSEANKESDNHKTTYTTGSWEDVLDEYVNALFDKDRSKADSLTDTSYYYIDNGLSENYRMHFVEDLAKYQEDVISSIEKMDGMVDSGKLDSYSLGYIVTTIDPYEDDEKVPWVDVYFILTVDFSANGQEDSGTEHYRISLRQYPEGWKVAWFAES